MVGVKWRVSPSMVVAFLALVFAMSGVTYATTRGPQGPRGKQGKKGPRGKTGKTGPTGKTGLQGIQGNQGIQGTPGAPGANGVVGAVQRVFDNDVVLAPGAAGESIARCPAGQIAISGGNSWEDDDTSPNEMTLTASERSDDGTAWIVDAVNDSIGSDPPNLQDFEAVAYCVTGGTATRGASQTRAPREPRALP